jgi:Ni/Co efflux regulator RcnB
MAHKPAADINFLIGSKIMQQHPLKPSYALSFVIAGIFITAPAFADKPSWNGQDQAGKHERREKSNHNRDHDDRLFQQRGGHESDKRDFGERRYFDDRHRAVIRDYYIEEYRSGHCPPGLLKKHNGCMPPGQAKKWRLGYPLPRNVVYYDLPQAIVSQLGLPMPGYRYARVDSDILLMAIGTGLVVDAIMDLGGY